MLHGLLSNPHQLMLQKNKDLPLIDRLSGFQKLFICLLFGVVAFLVFSSKNIDALARLMIGWDSFSLLMIVFGWITFFRTNAKQIRAQAKVQDENRVVIFIIVLIATLAGLIAVIILIITKTENHHQSELKIPVAIAGMFLSWLLIHTTFTLRYAHIFYGNHDEHPDTHAGGLDFPKENKPDYLDFAYFSFGVGMTFQVSDVEISSKRLRRLVLLHSLISFIYATIMIALTINVIS